MSVTSDIALNGRMVWLCFASFLAGMLNAVAGGGSFLSFPALLNLGVPPIQANATNTVALWPGQFTSIAAYWRDLHGNRHLLWPLGLAAAVGGVGGGVILLHTGQGTFLHLVPWLLLGAASLFAVSTPLSRWLQARARGKRMPADDLQPVRPLLLPLLGGMVLVTLYIGYFGAGAGFLVMSLLALFGIENVNQINALKVVTTTIANGMAVLLFIFEGQVLWQHCLLMMVTGAVGGYAGGRGARHVNARLMRVLVTVLGFTMAGYFFWRNGGL
jgi:uncharacterized membrane protein YfcA